MPARRIKGLKPIDRSQDLQPGQSFLVYFKNYSIGGRRDLWLGIIIPEALVTPKLACSRPKNARRATGESNVPIEDIAYGVYLPGKNTYVWSEKKNLYQIESSPPDLLTDPTRDDVKLFSDLHELVMQSPTDDFWFDMAVEERQVKGGLSKKSFLVLPSEFPKPDDDDGLQDVESQVGTKPGDDVSMVTECSDRSDSDIGDSVAGSSNDDVLKIYVGNGIDQTIFELTRYQISKCPVLLGCLAKGRRQPFVMHPDLYNIPASQFQPIHCFLSSGEYYPQLIDLNPEMKIGDDHSALGDQFNFGLKFELEGINSAAELHNQIERLGRVYVLAKQFELPKMQSLTLWKLQAAWNAYSGLPQLVPFLKTILYIYEETKDAPDSISQGTGQEPMQRWASSFLADVMPLVFRACSEQTWKILNANPELQSAVMEARAAKVIKSPQKYYESEKWFQPREEGRFPVLN